MASQQAKLSRDEPDHSPAPAPRALTGNPQLEASRKIRLTKVRCPVIGVWVIYPFRSTRPLHTYYVPGQP